VLALTSDMRLEACIPGADQGEYSCTHLPVPVSEQRPRRRPSSALVTAFVRRVNSLSAGVRLCRAERGVPRAEADDVGGCSDVNSDLSCNGSKPNAIISYASEHCPPRQGFTSRGLLHRVSTWMTPGVHGRLLTVAA
jgi:hypothetical protein